MQLPEGMTTVVVMLAAICGVVGWCVIEFVSWLFSHLALSWVG